ncbi:PREDICTED: uncharacterized protein LOC106819667 [Priapulus caudatus]|uniref:Uncharacterized protein LOC106819667 n=1 Tax=Priapulus caudatus TaxID=37621 RepID=A0ABM1F5M9_PRICU|nr:PREDICTED: uncharacterized protein LOC106819667 [Priapulus caudatus]
MAYTYVGIMMMTIYAAAATQNQPIHIPGIIMIPEIQAGITESTWALGFSVDLTQIKASIEKVKSTLIATAMTVKSDGHPFVITTRLEGFFHDHHWLQLKVAHLAEVFEGIERLTTDDIAIAQQYRCALNDAQH